MLYVFVNYSDTVFMAVGFFIRRTAVFIKKPQPFCKLFNQFQIIFDQIRCCLQSAFGSAELGVVQIMGTFYFLLPSLDKGPQWSLSTTQSDYDSDRKRD